MVSFPPCKINLGLNVLSKRADGYHNIETCFYPVPWTDILEIIPSKAFSFNQSGNVIPGNIADNLCLKAYNLLRKDFDLPQVKIHLHKIIPTGAGLGGGSADAAYTLRLLNHVFTLGLSKTQLMQYAATIGSDCAFFVQDKPVFASGRGEELHPSTVSLKGKFLAIAKPSVNVSTADAYGQIVAKIPSKSIREIIEHHPVSEWQKFLINDFEASVFRQYPVIGTLKQKLYDLGALYASMSGSGSSVFGIFENEIQLDQLPDLITWKGKL